MNAIRHKAEPRSRTDDVKMDFRKDGAARFSPYEQQKATKPKYHVEEPGRLLASGVGTRNSLGSEVFPEDHDPWRKKILDPGSDIILKWNYVFLISCLVALTIDPMFFYLRSIDKSGAICIKLDKNLSITITFFRTLTDLFYLLNIAIKFRTAYIAPSSRVFGRGELVMDRQMIAARYLNSDFSIDVAAALPVPQIVIWLVIPKIKNIMGEDKYDALALVVLILYIIRLYLIFPLSYQVITTTGVVAKRAWAGAVYNFLLYMIVSHVLGASWYFLSIERQITCWKSQCELENVSMKTPLCNPKFFYCDSLSQPEHQSWANATNVFKMCEHGNFNYGIFEFALTNEVLAANFVNKYFYCLWWGLQTLSSYGQTLETSTFVGETLFSILTVILGLVLFAHLIGNMQNYLQSYTIRLEEWRLKRMDTENWMRHRQLPQALRERVRQFVQYKWLATRGVEEESIMSALPVDLRRDIRRHLCWNLIRRVHFFSQMDDLLLDAICERLVPSLCTKGTVIVREGDPVTEMLFIIRGRLQSCTTNGGRTGFFNSITLEPGDFCGEELVEWALLSRSRNFPSSTTTVRALVAVETFALRAEDLKFVAHQFRRLHSKKLQHTLRFYSYHWRTWAACFIQAAWRAHKRRQTAKDLFAEPLNFWKDDDDETDKGRKQQDGSNLEPIE